MNCLRYISHCDIHVPKDSVEEHSVSSTWKSIWLATLRAISSHGLENASFELLQSIVKVFVSLLKSHIPLLTS